MIMVVGLEINLHTSDEAAALGQLAQVDALTEHIARHGELRIGTEVLGYGEQVVGLDPELQALQEG